MRHGAGAEVEDPPYYEGTGDVARHATEGVESARYGAYDVEEGAGERYIGDGSGARYSPVRSGADGSGDRRTAVSGKTSEDGSERVDREIAGAAGREY